MRTYSNFQSLVDVMEAIEFGNLEDIEIDIDSEDPRLQDAASLEEKRPLRQLALYVRNKGAISFDVLKIQNGLPMFGEQRVDEHTVKHLKFNKSR